MVRFAELEIFTADDGDIVLKQFSFGEDDQVVGFPPHQAKAICAAIMEAAKSGK